MRYYAEFKECVNWMRRLRIVFRGRRVQAEDLLLFFIASALCRAAIEIAVWPSATEVMRTLFGVALPTSILTFTLLGIFVYYVFLSDLLWEPVD